MERGRERCDREFVERLPEEAALVRDGTDDLVGNTGDAQLSADGIQVREEPLAHLLTDHDDGCTELELLRRDGSARCEVVLLDYEVVAVDRVCFHSLWALGVLRRRHGHVLT